MVAVCEVRTFVSRLFVVPGQAFVAVASTVFFSNFECPSGASVVKSRNLSTIVFPGLFDLASSFTKVNVHQSKSRCLPSFQTLAGVDCDSHFPIVSLKPTESVPSASRLWNLAFVFPTPGDVVDRIFPPFPVCLFRRCFCAGGLYVSAVPWLLHGFCCKPPFRPSVKTALHRLPFLHEMFTLVSFYAPRRFEVTSLSNHCFQYCVSSVFFSPWR